MSAFLREKFSSRAATVLAGVLLVTWRRPAAAPEG
jgi:hypothetical protein